jgi:preprotein translocase subunit SecE
MARLQRKKQTTGKKKAPSEVEAVSTPSNDAAAPVAAETTPAGKEVRKRSAPAPARRPIAERKPPGRIGQWIERAAQFLREVKVELKKVTWPSRKQTIGSTVVVIVLVMVISLFLGVVDVGLSSLIRVVLQSG